jgi:endonuclease G, mitochondrial
MPAIKRNSPWLLPLCIILVVILILVYRQRSQNKTATNDTPVSTAAVAGDDGNLLLGNPTNAVHNRASPDNFFIDHGYYVESYNSSNGIPNWVSWHIGAKDLGKAERKDDFRADENLPKGFYAADESDYKNTGFDKGHNCPSADRTASDEANSSTFLMDNIIPQAPNNNQHIWEHLERYCRDQVKKGNEVFVIMGNYGSGGTGRKGYKSNIASGKINVPAHIWKVAVILPEGNNDLARINNSTRVIAIDTPNDNNVSNDWMDYTTTISSIEQRCNCNLLSALPASLQQEIEGKKFTGGN